MCLKDLSECFILFDHRVQLEIHQDHQAAAVPDYCDLKVEEGTAVNYLVKAVLTGFEPGEPHGKANVIRYQFVGQDYTTTAP